jgi:C4-dicarboxylate transporter DctM subunit
LDVTTIGILGIVLLFVLLALGLHIGLCMLLVGAAGAILILGLRGGMNILAVTPFSTAAAYAFAPLPLFFLMGAFAFYGGFGAAAYEAANRWLGKLHGGLAIATTFANAMFGMVSGSSMAATAVFTKVSLDEMLDRGYDKKLAIGTIASAGTFAVMIPPSGLFILYGMLTDESIGKLFLAGIIPGFIMAAVFAVFIYLRVRLNPRLAPLVEQNYNIKEKMTSLVSVWPIIFLFALVIGGMLTGMFTPTESAAVGAVGALIIAIILKGPRKIKFRDSLVETMRNTGMVFLIFIGAMIFGRFLAVTRLPTGLAELVLGLHMPRLVVLIAILVVYFILGMFLNAGAIMALTIPIIVPVLKVLEYDMIWFGVVTILLMEMGLITPPVGMNVYVATAVADGKVSMEETFAGILPFLPCDFIMLILLIVFPEICLYLPGLMSPPPV